MKKMWIILTANFLFAFTVSIEGSHATWKRDYAKEPAAVQAWFHAQQIMPAAAVRLGYGKGVSCCDHGDRVMTKFVNSPSHQWSYYSDPTCTNAGCPLTAIPDDTIHPEQIHALDPQDDHLPEFDAMRREGVLMIYEGRVTCFWSPQPGI